MVLGQDDKQLSQMRRGSIEYCVLAMLRDRDKYGFELAKELAAADGLVTSEGTVYPLLARLRREGLVETYWQESREGPPRRYYRLTTEGLAALVQFGEQWTRFRETVDAILKGRF
jgi:PadR family transcriptional regulator PadR